jgi:hypothetical protein
MIRHRELRAAGQAASPGVAQLLDQAFAIVAGQ